MNRRHFVLAVLVAAYGRPAIGFAQASRGLKRMGWLGAGVGTSKAEQALHTAFVDQMRKLGWVEGRTIEYLTRDPAGDPQRVEGLARELVAAKVDLIFAPFGPHAIAVRNVTREIPIVFAITGDPVASGLAASLAHPGGNATGPSTIESELRGPRLQYLREAVPSIRRVAVMMNPDVEWNVEVYKQLSELCAKLGLESFPIPVRGREDFAPGVARAVRERADALLHMPDGLYYRNRRALTELVARTRLAATYTTPEFADEGGLMSYAIDLADLFLRAAMYVDKILRGANPGDLPVERPARFEFVVNLKTARAQGFKIPQSVLLHADRVIE